MSLTFSDRLELTEEPEAGAGHRRLLSRRHSRQDAARTRPLTEAPEGGAAGPGGAMGHVTGSVPRERRSPGAPQARLSREEGGQAPGASTSAR